MALSSPEHRPGDIILNRYFKSADGETRERAREAFAELARIMEEIADEILAKASSDSRDCDDCGRIPPTPQP